MSRGIPKVRKWHVTTEDGRSCTVETINKRFARWIARETLGYPEGHLRVSAVRADWRPLIPNIPGSHNPLLDWRQPTRCADGDHTFDVAESYATLSVRPCIVCGMRPTQADIDAILSDPNTRGA